MKIYEYHRSKALRKVLKLGIRVQVNKYLLGLDSRISPELSLEIRPVDSRIRRLQYFRRLCRRLGAQFKTHLLTDTLTGFDTTLGSNRVLG